MSSINAAFCPVCGNPVESATAIHTDDALPPEARGSFERSGAHAQVGEREVCVFVHGEGDAE